MKITFGQPLIGNLSILNSHFGITKMRRDGLPKLCVEIFLEFNKEYQLDTI